MLKKIERMLKLFKRKLEDANSFDQHADALRWEGAVLVLSTLLIYAEEEAKENGDKTA